MTREPRRPIRQRRARRSFVLLVVMIVLGGALFIATTMIHMMHANAAAAAGAQTLEQSRCLARSGLAAVVDELNAQRDLILDGESPRLESQYVLFEDDARLGVVRLLPIGPAEETLVAEAGKLDVNRIDAEALERTGVIEPDVAGAIISFRDQLGRPMQSIEELLYAPGVSSEAFYGDITEITPLDDAQLNTGTFADRLQATYQNESIRGLCDLLTVHAFEPALQRNGRLRIDINVEWSEDLRDRLSDRFDAEVAEGVKTLIDRDVSFESDAKFFELLLLFAADDPQEWVEYVDAFRFKPHDYLAGRLDLNTAPYEALLALPTITAEQARGIVDSRDNLAGDDRATVVWPATESLIEPQQYRELGGTVTTRCWNWRIRLAAGTVSIDEPDGELEQPVIFEAVIDLSAPQPRVAYLRDITQWQAAAFIAGDAQDPDELPEEDLAEAPTDDTDLSDPSSDENADFASDNRESDDDDRGRAANPRDRGGNGRAPNADRAENDPDSEADTQDSTQADPSPQRLGRWRSAG